MQGRVQVDTLSTKLKGLKHLKKEKLKETKPLLKE